MPQKELFAQETLKPATFKKQIHHTLTEYTTIISNIKPATVLHLNKTKYNGPSKKQQIKKGVVVVNVADQIMHTWSGQIMSVLKKDESMSLGNHSYKSF